MKYISGLILFLSCLSKPIYAQLSDTEIKILKDNKLFYLKDSLKSISDFQEGYAKVKYLNGFENYIKKDGQLVYPKVELTEMIPKYRLGKTYFIFVKEKKKVGLIDALGNVILPAEYNLLDYYNNYGYLSLRKDDKFILLSSSFKTLFESEYLEVNSILSDSLVVLTNVRNIYSGKLSHKTAVQNIYSNKIILPFDFYERINNWGWGISSYKDGYMSFSNLNGDIIIPSNLYRRFTPFDQCKLIKALNENGSSVIDSTGKIIIPTGIYDEIDGYSIESNLFRVKSKGLFGAVNNKNEITIPIIYNSLSSFLDDGTALATIENERFYITKKNHRIGNYKYNLYQGYRVYKYKDTIGYVDPSGQIYPFPQYQLHPRQRDMELRLVQTKNMKWGVVNTQFKLLLDTVYDEIVDLKEKSRFVVVRIGNKYGVIDIKTNKAVIPVKNEKVNSLINNTYEIINDGKTETISLE